MSMQVVLTQPYMETGAWLVLGQFQYNRLYRKSSFSRSKYCGKIQNSILYRSKYWIINKLISKIFSLFAKFYMMISPKMASKPYIKTQILNTSKHWYWKSSNRNSSQRNIDIENILPPNHVEPKSLKFYFEPALVCGQSIDQRYDSMTLSWLIDNW